MGKAAEVIRFYTLCNRLKDVVRSGWKVWHVKRERLESIAEHIYGVQMLAIAMWSEYQYELDIEKVIMMLAVHELEEIKIGDFALFEIETEEKLEKGHAAVEQVLDGLTSRDKIRELVFEFDERKTAEAKFAYSCDKLEADLQCCLYDSEGDVDLAKQEGNHLMETEQIRNGLEKEETWSKMWLKYSQGAYRYDENFMEVSEFAYKNGVKSEKSSASVC